MTDKQIIIDNIDVSGCEHINACDKKMKCVILQDDVCETNPYCEGFNCYYKQLKRAENHFVDLNKTIKAKEKECENNKIAHQMELDIYNQECLNLQEELKEALEQLDQLKAENEELRNKLSESLIFRFISQDNEIYKLKTENEHLSEKEEEARHYLEEAEKFKDCLTAIKEIATCCIEGDVARIRMKQILQKISECEVKKCLKKK